MIIGLKNTNTHNNYSIEDQIVTVIVLHQSFIKFLKSNFLNLPLLMQNVNTRSNWLSSDFMLSVNETRLLHVISTSINTSGFCIKSNLYNYPRTNDWTPYKRKVANCVINNFIARIGRGM